MGTKQLPIFSAYFFLMATKQYTYFLYSYYYLVYPVTVARLEKMWAWLRDEKKCFVCTLAGVHLQDSSNGQFSKDLSRSDSRCIKMSFSFRVYSTEVIFLRVFLQACRCTSCFENSARGPKNCVLYFRPYPPSPMLLGFFINKSRTVCSL